MIAKYLRHNCSLIAEVLFHDRELQPIGDLYHFARKLPPDRHHFPAGLEAILLHALWLHNKIKIYLTGKCRLKGDNLQMEWH
jgi:hypothetical protein